LRVPASALLNVLRNRGGAFDVFLVLGAILLVAILVTLLLKKPARAAAR
jgi:hypothetical protein